MLSAPERPPRGCSVGRLSTRAHVAILGGAEIQNFLEDQFHTFQEKLAAASAWKVFESSSSWLPWASVC